MGQLLAPEVGGAHVVPDAAYLGGQALDRIYQGGEQVWPPGGKHPSEFLGLAGWWAAADLSGSMGAVPTSWTSRVGPAMPKRGDGGTVTADGPGGLPVVKFASVATSGGYGPATVNGIRVLAGTVYIDGTSATDNQSLLGASTLLIRHRPGLGTVVAVFGGSGNLPGSVPATVGQWIPVIVAINSDGTYYLLADKQVYEDTWNTAWGAASQVGVGYYIASSLPGFEGKAGQVLAFTSDFSRQDVLDLAAWMNANVNG